VKSGYSRACQPGAESADMCTTPITPGGWIDATYRVTVTDPQTGIFNICNRTDFLTAAVDT
jgi:hypothetical protein